MIERKSTLLLKSFAWCFGVLLSTNVLAQDVTLADIKIEGLERIEPATIFGTLKAKIGSKYDDSLNNQSVRQIYDLGLFSDVDVALDGNVLVVKVQENPIIAQIEFIGAKVIKKDELKRSVASIGLIEGYALNTTVIEQVRREIKRSYLQQGRYAAEVMVKTETLDNKQVKVIFDIIESVSTKVTAINITGNQHYSAKKIRGEMKLSTGGWFSWYTRARNFNRDKLEADLAAIEAFYKNNGFLEFSVESSNVAISADKRTVDINIKVNEGARFTVSKVDLTGDLLGKDEDFKRLIRIPAGKVYNEELLQETIAKMMQYYGKFGYAFANVQAYPKIDREKSLVELTLVAQPNVRAYVRRIDVAGNDRTKDEVIRRELRQLEGEWYNATSIERSRVRLDRLGYFSEVDINQQPVDGAPDQADLVVNVKEQDTGQFEFGVSYSQQDRIGLNLSVSQNNFLGTGHAFNAAIATGKYNQRLSLSSTNPYFTRHGVSRTYNMFYTKQKPYDNWGSDYHTSVYGGSIDFGIPFSEDDQVVVGVGAQRYKIDAGAKAPKYVEDYTTAYGRGSTILPLTVGWVKNTTNSYWAPTSGGISRINFETSFVGDVRYMKLELQRQQYVPLTKRIALGFNAEYNIGKPMGGKLYPFYKNFYGGGLGSVRGFAQGSLGPRDGSSPGGGNVEGGQKALVLNAEVLFQVPNLQSVRAFAFFDAGNVYRHNQRVKFDKLRLSAGVGINWQSPIGPLRLSYGVPVRSFDGDELERFQFQVGTTF